MKFYLEIKSQEKARKKQLIRMMTIIKKRFVFIIIVIVNFNFIKIIIITNINLYFLLFIDSEQNLVKNIKNV